MTGKVVDVADISRVKLNKKGVAELLKSPRVKLMIIDRSEAVEARAASDAPEDVNVQMIDGETKTRVRGRVLAMQIPPDDTMGWLARALDAGKV